jgi:hypothetical protein
MSSSHTARVEDLSVGGCFVDTVGRVEFNEAVNLEIQLPAGEWLSLRGQVASYQPGVGFGMSFTALSEVEVAALENLMSSLDEKFI